jgi:hypothetical protein
MTVAEPRQLRATKRVCPCDEPLVQTRVRGKWLSDHYCRRCGLLTPIVFRR